MDKLTRIGVSVTLLAMKVLSPAKLNLFLHVGPRREDGFHPLSSWMCTIGLYDTLDFQLNHAQADTTASDIPLITLKCDHPELATDQSNLIVRAATALAQTKSSNSEVKQTHTGNVTVSLQKQIPMGAGLGGGSSNAASTLLALNQLWQMRLSIEQLHEIAMTLGSDVPFFLHAPSAWCTGRGEKVRPEVVPACQSTVVLLPPVHTSTPQVYKQFDQMSLGAIGNIEKVPSIEPLATLSATELLDRLHNDLQAPAFAIHPELAMLKDEAQAIVEQPILLTGSGSSLFTLFDEPHQAAIAASQLEKRLRIKTVAVPLAPMAQKQESPPL